MTVQKADGTRLTKSTLVSTLLTEVPQPKVYTVNEDIFETYNESGQFGSRFESEKRRLFVKGQKIKDADLNRAFKPVKAERLTGGPAATAGGTVITVYGDNFKKGFTVTVGGTAASNVVVKNGQTLTFVAPAKTAGTYDVVIAGDSGNVSVSPVNGALTYA